MKKEASGRTNRLSNDKHRKTLATKVQAAGGGRWTYSNKGGGAWKGVRGGRNTTQPMRFTSNHALGVSM